MRLIPGLLVINYFEKNDYYCNIIINDTNVLCLNSDGCINILSARDSKALKTLIRLDSMENYHKQMIILCSNLLH
jgi:hypothetical protein